MSGDASVALMLKLSELKDRTEGKVLCGRYYVESMMYGVLGMYYLYVW